MIKRIKRFLKISNEDVLMIVLALTSFSVGIWSNYRQLWLETKMFSVTEISRIFSIALICSALIACITSFISTKIRIKDVILESSILRAIAMSILLFTNDTYIIKTCILICIICEVIFSISYYPLLSYVNKSNSTYKKKTLIDFIAKDAGIICCGLLIGKLVGNRTFDYNSCLFLALVSALLSAIFLLLFNKEETHSEENTSFVFSIKRLFKSNINIWYLISQTLVYISYGMIFDLMMLILTGYIKFGVSFTSIFIISCNILGSVACLYFNKKDKRYSISKSAWIKFGLRALAYFIAFVFNNVYIFVFSIVVAHVTSRILEDKVTGNFLNIIDKEDQFLYGNIRYFVLCIGEGIGTFLAGILLGVSDSLQILFLGAAIVTFLQVLTYIYLDKLYKRRNKSVL